MEKWGSCWATYTSKSEGYDRDCPNNDDFLIGFGAARDSIRATAPRDDYWDHPHVGLRLFLLPKASLKSALPGVAFPFSDYSTRDELGRYSSAEISGGKLGHWSCAKSLVHGQCASLDAEETVKASNKGRTNNGYALGAAEPRV